MGGLPGRLCPVLSEFRERAELVGVESVAALALVGEPYPCAVLRPIGQKLDASSAGQPSTFPFDVLREGLYALLDGFRASPGGRARRRGHCAGPYGLCRLHPKAGEAALLLLVWPVEGAALGGEPAADVLPMPRDPGHHGRKARTAREEGA
ncbi:hypothetical protein OV450_4677 [Actinobacteria bacterium OV450]|nr:hypothetical protein OV450_4677 [Actinobacteria bacterium OV450]